MICRSKCRPLNRSSIGANRCISSSSPATLAFAPEPQKGSNRLRGPHPLQGAAPPVGSRGNKTRENLSRLAGARSIPDRAEFQKSAAVPLPCPSRRLGAHVEHVSDATGNSSTSDPELRLLSLFVL